MTNYHHLSREQRDIIHQLLNNRCNFTEIATAIKTDRTTVSKEIRRNRVLSDHFNLPFNKNGIKKAANSCEFLSKAPYCCNGCKSKSSCMKAHLFYKAKEAQNNYENNLSSSRQGYDITKEEVGIINKNIVPLIKYKNQSVNQIYINHPNILTFSKPTFYKYVNERIIDLDNLDLNRKVKYKKRKKKRNTVNKRDMAVLEGRRYEDFLARIEKDRKLKIWQLDTVIGKSSDKQTLLTFLMQETNFMIIRLLDKKDILNVNNAFTDIKNSLSSNIYKEHINIILTDNGSEFYDPLHMELDLGTGEVLSSLYYCHPNSPYEKAELERNHEYIRQVLPKKTSFEFLTKEEVKLLEDNINNIPREILGNKSPYDLVKEKYPILIEKFKSNYIKPDLVSLNPDDILISMKKQK